MKLSPHFTLEEMLVSQEAVRRGIGNTPDDRVLSELKRLAMMLEHVRDIFGGKPVVVTSGYRSPELNLAVKGSATSQHMLGQAADIIIPGISPRAVCLGIADSNVAFDQLILEYNAWTHISINAVGVRPRKQLLTYVRGKKFPLSGIV